MKKIKNVKEGRKFKAMMFGLYMCTVTHIAFIITFFRAMLSPNHEFIFSINVFNEATAEAMLMIFFIPFSFYFIIQSAKQLKKMKEHII